MEKTRHYDIEGTLLEIPLHYDELAQMYVEIYPDFIENPVYTPEGCPILFTGEDACAYAESRDGNAVSTAVPAVFTGSPSIPGSASAGTRKTGTPFGSPPPSRHRGKTNDLPLLYAAILMQPQAFYKN